MPQLTGHPNRAHSEGALRLLVCTLLEHAPDSTELLVGGHYAASIAHGAR
jgi:hypothetical protein